MLLFWTLKRWAVDINQHACKSLKLNHPETQVRFYWHLVLGTCRCFFISILILLPKLQSGEE